MCIDVIVFVLLGVFRWSLIKGYFTFPSRLFTPRCGSLDSCAALSLCCSQHGDIRDETTFFGDARTKQWAKITGKISSAVRIPDRNRSDVVELVGRDRLFFAKVEIHITMIMFMIQKKCRKIKHAIYNLEFWPEMFHFSERRNARDRLLFARVEIDVT